MSPPPLSLPSSSVANFFAQPDQDSAVSLASIINYASPTELDPLLDSVIHQFLLSAFAQRGQIDTLTTFLASVATNIAPSVSHSGVPDKQYKSTPLLPATGPDILAERLSKTLYERLWDSTSRAYTPDEDSDKQREEKYYADTCILTSVLARAFATQPHIFRERLWREIEDIIVKALFSGPEQEPGVFVALSVILLGAGAEIKQYLTESDGKRGHGKGWLWYDDVRTHGDEMWGWAEVMDALKTQPGEEMLLRLPAYVKVAFDSAKQEIGDGHGDPVDYNDGRLEDVFRWVDRV